MKKPDRRSWFRSHRALGVLGAWLAAGMAWASVGLAPSDPPLPPEAAPAFEAAAASAEAAVVSPLPWSPDAAAWRTALADVRHLTDVAADHPAAWRLSFRVHALVGWTARALEAAEAWRALGGPPTWSDPDPPVPAGPPSVALLRRAQAEHAFARYQAGAKEEAVAGYEALLADHPDDLEARRWLGRLWLELGDADTALPYWTEVVAADPDDAGARYFLTLATLAVQVGPAASQAFADGVAALEAGRPEEAVAAFARARTLAPTFVDAFVWSARAALAAGAADDAVAYYGAALALRPDDPTLAYLLEVAKAQVDHGIDAGQAYHDGLAAWRVGELDRAQEALERATVAAPAYADAWRALAALLQERGALQEAQVAWEQLLAIVPGDHHAQAALNVVRAQRAYGGSDAAATEYAAGVAAFERGDFPAADRHFRAVIDLDPASVRAWVWLGRLAFDRGDYGEAVEAFDRALAIDPDDADVQWFAGEARARLAPPDAP